MSKSIEHTPECIARQQALDAWLERWRNYCKACVCHPLMVSPATREQPEEQDWCAACIGIETVELPDGTLVLEQGYCPRCHTLMSCENRETACPGCGWAWGKGKDDYPPEAECWCEAEQLAHDQNEDNHFFTRAFVHQDDSLHFGTNWQAW